MNTKWTRTITAVAVSAALMTQGLALTAYADAGVGTTALHSVQYQLTQALKAEVKSVLSDKTEGGVRIAVVIRLENTGSRVMRVPEYELRAKTTDGLEYTLAGSLTNYKSILAKEKIELSYMAFIDRDVAVSIDEIEWVKVNKYVYPMEETVMLSVPASSMTWQGEDSVISEPAALKKWGEAFRIPVLSENLEFTPLFTVNQSTEQGPVTLVAMLAENRGERTETIPAFTLEGRSETKSFQGVMVQSNVELKKGEKKTIHFLIPHEANETLKSVNVVTPEKFVTLGNQAVGYTVGRLNILLPAKDNTIWDMVPQYKMGDAMVFDPYSKLVDRNLSVSLIDLTMNGNDADGFQTIMAKLVVRNNHDRPLALPALGMELSSEDGYTYVGTRQDGASQILMPKLGYVVNYSFTVPSSEKGDKLLLKMLDDQLVSTMAPQLKASYGVPISAYKVVAQPVVNTGDELSFYPYSVKLKYWNINTDSSMVTNYTYRIKMDLDIKKTEDVVVNAKSSYMKLELVDSVGRVIGAQNFSFTGNNALISGEQTLTFSNISTYQHLYPMQVRVYEAVQTPTGEAKRLVKVLKQ
ncbi:hypothetical protein [Gorillibacterium sp. sgz5001074]|uniref:hypothetical protein n=1 Tax=Gorillibacterium sp. sgz5001074 TaxID=3446695 RepID=UPI003F66F311